MQDILHHLLQGHSLDEHEAGRAFQLILSGQANESQVGALLALVAVRGPVLDEVVGAARVMRAHVSSLPIAADDPLRASLIDTCGTGGTPKLFNISTASAILAAAATPAPGRPRAFVAKHGGRSRSGRGSAEVLAALGVNIDATPAQQARCLREAGVCFSFAVNHHPAMKFAAGPRKSLGFPTIFNLLGPLANPAQAQRQLMGVYEKRYALLVAQALARLGAARAMVVHGNDGLDELTTCAPTLVAHVEAGAVRTEEFDAAALGIPRATHADLAARDLEGAADLVRAVLGGAAGPALNVVLLNAAAALVVAGAHESLPAAMAAAQHAAQSGAGLRTHAQLAALSHERE